MDCCVAEEVMDDSEEDFPDWRAVKEVGQLKRVGRRNEKSSSGVRRCVARHTRSD